MAVGLCLKLIVPLRTTVPRSGSNSIRFRVNPDIVVLGYPSVALLVNNDVPLRSPFEDNRLTFDSCMISPPASGC